MKINTIIFSKNRAAQLDLLLRSIKRFAPWLISDSFHVLYKYDVEYQSGYSIVIDENKDIIFINEKNYMFQDQVVSLISNCNSPLTMFLVDDIIFLRDNRLNENDQLNEFLNNDRICTFSQRIWSEIKYCYTMGIDMSTPSDFNYLNLTWKWRGNSGDWGYPNSLDGNFFRTDQILKQIKSYRFNNPNLMEGYMGGNWNISGELMKCVSEPLLVNNPCNRVQNVYNNKYGIENIVIINNMFISGKRLSMDHIIGTKPKAVHTEYPLIWI